MEFHPEGIFLEADVYVRMVRTMQTDCRVLESFKIMDYSLLVGIHNLDQAAREKSVSIRAKITLKKIISNLWIIKKLRKQNTRAIL